ncbi:MAG TPA: ABC transporter substrate-binding protein [Burkholderiales bacterium]|nr:ABC transporter substrate-binding protein [Burkholderiales bacterium]
MRRERGWSRREFVSSALAGTAFLGMGGGAAGAEPPPETTRLRLLKTGSICWAPQYIAEDLLRAEGFTDVSYVDMPTGAVSVRLAAGDADMSLNFVGPNIIRVEAGDPVVFLAGVHVGCFEVVATERIQRIRDLKGKVAAVASLNGAEHVFLASIAANVGLDPHRDIKWISPEGHLGPYTNEGSMRLFLEGKADVFLGFPPQPQELRARKVGHVIVNSATDRPWSQYFCCLLTARKEFVRRNPVATRRALRAILKSADACAADPQGAARALVDKGYAGRYEYALQVMRELPYGKWREYDPEDTIRFYALRLQEAGMIKSTPQKIIAQGTDWRFLHALRKELKA